MYQVDEGLRLMEAEGEGVFARHAACAAMTRAGLRAMGFELLASDDVASKTVTAAWIPETLDWKTFNAGLKKRGLVLAGGQGKLKGRIFRLGHLGSVTTDDILAAIGVLEATAIECGVAVGARGGRRGRPAGARRERRGQAMRILVVEPLAAEGLELLRRHHDVDERLGLPRDEIAAILPEYDALVVRSQVKVDAALIAAGTRLVVIGRAGVGVDNVDLEAATRAGIVVVNAPTGNTIAAAELTLALLFGLARKTAAADASMRRGEWKRSAVHRDGGARQDPGHRGPGQDRPGHRRPSPGHADDGARLRPVRDPRPGREPRRGARRLRRAGRPFRRDHRPRAQEQGDHRPDQCGRHRAG